MGFDELGRRWVVDTRRLCINLHRTATRLHEVCFSRGYICFFNPDDANLAKINAPADLAIAQICYFTLIFKRWIWTLEVYLEIDPLLAERNSIARRLMNQMTNIVRLTRTPLHPRISAYLPSFFK
jgi:hypothetical protein